MSSNLKPVTPLIVAHLIKSNEKFKLLEANNQEAVSASEWLENNFPIAPWGRVAWDKVPDSSCTALTDSSELPLAFEKIVLENELNGDVTVLWTNALKSPLELDLTVVLKYSNLFFEEDWDTWIYSNKDEWCIEVFHDGDMCFGKPCLSKL